MKTIGICLVLASLIICTSVDAQPAAFQAGEKITYAVYYKVVGLYVNAGTATFTTSKENYLNREVFHVVGEGITNTRYDWIFKVRDRYESYFDSKSFESMKFIRHVNEGDYKKHEEVTFNEASNTALTPTGVYKVPDKTKDVLNALYHTRSIDYNAYKVGEKISFKLFVDNEVYDMYVRYLGKETITTKYGKFKVLKLKPLLLKGSIFDGGEKMNIWITDDANHIPVRIESPIIVGTVMIDMMQYQNIKTPLASLIAFNR